MRKHEKLQIFPRKEGQWRQLAVFEGKICLKERWKKKVSFGSKAGHAEAKLHILNWH